MSSTSVFSLPGGQTWKTKTSAIPSLLFPFGRLAGSHTLHLLGLCRAKGLQVHQITADLGEVHQQQGVLIRQKRLPPPSIPAPAGAKGRKIFTRLEP